MNDNRYHFFGHRADHDPEIVDAYEAKRLSGIAVVDHTDDPAAYDE